MITIGATTLRVLFWENRVPIMVVLLLVGGIEVSEHYWDLINFERSVFSMAALGLLTTALSIFLVFRVNEAYARWWEARILWGGVVNSSRTFARQATTLLRQYRTDADVDEGEIHQGKQELVYRHLAYVNALRMSLRREDDWQSLSPFLFEVELTKLVAQANKPTQLLQIQGRRVEFVGPQVGEELTEQGGLAMLYTLIAVLVYVMLRFEWRFAVGAIVAISHDVILTFGFFSLLQLEFSLSVLAAMLAVLGYSLNDTIVVFDRIRENFRKMRKGTTAETMNASINQTLSRTIITSTTTLLTVLALFVLGGEIIRGFSIALIVGIVVGTYSSIYVATPAVLAMGVSREDLMPVKKEGVDDSAP